MATPKKGKSKSSNVVPLKIAKPTGGFLEKFRSRRVRQSAAYKRC